MVRIGWVAPTDEARMPCHKAQVILVASSPRRGKCKAALIDLLSGIDCRLQGSGFSRCIDRRTLVGDPQGGRIRQLANQAISPSRIGTSGLLRIAMIFPSCALSISTERSKFLRERGLHEIRVGIRERVLDFQRSFTPSCCFARSREFVAFLDRALARGGRGLRLEPRRPRLVAWVALRPPRLRKTRGRATYRS